MKANYIRNDKMLDKLINEELQKAAIREETDTMALVLYILSEKFGFGKVRLERFQKAYHDGLKELCKFYELDDTDSLFLARRKLNDLGIDVEKFAKENV